MCVVNAKPRQANWSSASGQVCPILLMGRKHTTWLYQRNYVIKHLVKM